MVAELAAPRGPRVLLLAHDVHEDGGMERTFAELIRRAGDKLEFTVVSGTLAPDLRPLVQWRRVPIPRRPFPLKFLAYFAFAPFARRGARVELVHTMGAIAPVRADLASVHFCHRGFVRRTGRRSPADAPPLRRLNTALTRTLALAAELWCYRPSVTRVLACVSPGLEAEVATEFPGVRTYVTPNGVDHDRFRPNAETRNALRSDLGAGRNEVVALFVGGDWDRKGLGLAVAGLARALPADDPGLRLWVVGPGDVDRFASLAQELGVLRRVQFLGPQRDVERYLQAADLLVLPSLYEAAPLVGYEAAASGLPVLATRVSGIVDLVELGQGGLLVERTADALGTGLRRLADDPAERARLGASGRHWAESFTWRRSVDSVLALYDELLDGNERRRGSHGTDAARG